MSRSSHYSLSKYAKPLVSSDDSTKRLKPTKYRLNGMPIEEPIVKAKIQKAGMNIQSAFDRHKTLVNNYLSYHGSAGRKAMRLDKTKFKRDIDVVKENHKFLWEDGDGDEENPKSLSWEQRIAKKYWDKLFKEYAITDLTYYKKNRIAFRWRIEKEVIEGKGQFICAQKKTCSETEGLRTWEVPFGYAEDDKKKMALVKVRLCAECSAKLNHNTKYTEIRRAQNRVALLQEQQEQLTKDQNQLARKKRKAEEEEKIKSDPDAAKKRKTAREVQQQIKDDEEALVDEETDPDAIWSKPAAVDEEKTKEQEYDEFFQDLFL
jgi:protein FRA10AC1